jgi:flagellar biosynthesis/type III secretory pathway chaperone
MQAVMNDISQRLGQEVDLYRRLLDVVIEERDILLEGGHERLMGTTERKLAICKDLAMVQDDRRELMQKLSPDSKAPLKLSDLADYLPENQQGPFHSLVSKLRRMSARLSELNDMNKSYIEDALDTVEGLLQAITGGGRGAAYGNKGTCSNGPSVPRLVTREV